MLRLNSLRSCRVSLGHLAYLQRSRLCRSSVCGQEPIPWVAQVLKWHNRVCTHIANFFLEKISWPHINSLFRTVPVLCCQLTRLLPSHTSASWCETKAPDKVLITTLTISDHRAVLELIPSPIIHTFWGNVSKYLKSQSRGYSGWSYKEDWCSWFLGCQEW